MMCFMKPMGQCSNDGLAHYYIPLSFIQHTMLKKSTVDGDENVLMPACLFHVEKTLDAGVDAELWKSIPVPKRFRKEPDG